MKSPITGKEMVLHNSTRKVKFRKEDYEISYQYYQEGEEKYTTTELDEDAINNLHNQYRKRHNIPTAGQIKSIRDQYGLSAKKMSAIMGFGANGWRLYESGEIPSESSARLIQLAADPAKFKTLLELSPLPEKDKQKLFDKLNRMPNNEQEFEFKGHKLIIRVEEVFN